MAGNSAQAEIRHRSGIGWLHLGAVCLALVAACCLVAFAANADDQTRRGQLDEGRGGYRGAGASASDPSGLDQGTSYARGRSHQRGRFRRGSRGPRFGGVWGGGGFGFGYGFVRPGRNFTYQGEFHDRAFHDYAAGRRSNAGIFIGRGPGWGSAWGGAWGGPLWAGPGFGYRWGPGWGRGGFRRGFGWGPGWGLGVGPGFGYGGIVLGARADTGRFAGTLGGAIIGGLIGAEIDGGHNRTTGAVVGALTGAAIGAAATDGPDRRPRDTEFEVERGNYGGAYYGRIRGRQIPRGNAQPAPGTCLSYRFEEGRYICTRRQPRGAHE